MKRTPHSRSLDSWAKHPLGSQVLKALQPRPSLKPAVLPGIKGSMLRGAPEKKKPSRDKGIQKQKRLPNLGTSLQFHSGVSIFGTPPKWLRFLLASLYNPLQTRTLKNKTDPKLGVLLKIGALPAGGVVGPIPLI